MSGVSAAICSMSGISSLCVPRWPLTMMSCPPKKVAASGWPPVGADVRAPRWPAARPGRCPRRSGPAGIGRMRGPQAKSGWSSCSAMDTVDRDAAVDLVDVPGAGRATGPPSAAKNEDGSPTRSARTRASVGPGQRYSSRDGTWSGRSDVVEDPHDDRIVAGSLGDGEASSAKSLAAIERAAVGELRTQGGEHKRPIGIVAGSRSRATPETSTLSASIAPTRCRPTAVVGQGGGHQRSVSPRRPPGAQRRGGCRERRVAGLALGGAEPDGQIERRTGSGSSTRARGRAPGRSPEGRRQGRGH